MMRKTLRKILSINGEPKTIARGFALGSFIGMLPIPGFQMLVSLAIAAVIKVNKKAACIGVFNTNVATGAFVFAFNYWLGKSILNLSPHFVMPEKIGFSFIFTVLESGKDVFLCMLTGGIITGLIALFSVYYITMYYFKVKQYATNK
ncbi:DUF2062 domain-containing protein [Saccharicrinis sp. FJH62]|uniref:DUF2062 domain-containing protein n=1 Tax=Saccharicrinis sp. FJH62 TaxID=3344657 RepID=UPI0035D506DF